MLRLNKKGLILNLLVLFFAVILIIAGFYAALKQGNLGNAAVIGKDQVEQVRTYQFAEEKLFSLDLAAQYSARAALLDRAWDGMGDGCGEYAGYTVWSDGDATCFPEATDAGFSHYFNKHMNQYRDTLKMNYAPSNNYEIITRQEGDTLVVLGTARESIEFPIGKFGFGLYVHDEKKATSSDDGYPFIPSPNYNFVAQRDITTVVLYASRTLTAKQLIDAYQDPATKKSTHFIIDRDGSITQMVREKDVAWHCKSCDTTNEKSISITLVNLFDLCAQSDTCKKERCCKTPACSTYYKSTKTASCVETYDERQVNALSTLLKEIAQRNKKIALTTKHIVAHADVEKGYDDPGPALEVRLK